MNRAAQFFAAMALPLLVSVPARADLAFVLNSADAYIAVLNGRTREEVRRVPVLREAHHLVPTPDRSLLLVGDSGGNEMIFLDPATGEVRSRERIANPYHLDFSPDGKRLVVTGLRRDQVDFYGWDGTALSFQGRARAGDMPSHLAFSPDGRTVFITLQGDRQIAAIDVESRDILWKLEVGREPAGVVWHRDRLLVGIMGSDNIAVVNPATRQIERRITVGRGAHTVFPSPDGSVLYVTSRLDSRITALDPGTLDIRRTYEVAGGPDCLTFAPDGKIWTTLRWAGRVAVLDPVSGEYDTVRVGRSPHGILYRAGAEGVVAAVPASGEPPVIAAPPGPAAIRPSAATAR